MKAIFTISLITLPSLSQAADLGANALDYGGGAWSPFVVGAGIGILSWLTFALAGKAIGASSFYATVAGFIGMVVAPGHTRSLKYYQDNPPRLDWGFAFVIATVLGGFLAAWSGGEIKDEWLHPMWTDRFGDSLLLRAAIGMAGGLLMAFGARLAGGCTSGHGISGTLQLSAGSWLTVIAMFIGGIATAMLLYLWL
ncbi:YeeE/YedE thiosulfate transporter family protein [Prosthecobacter sp. SYSU 5D2]|uniref:YeeE/YedE thiosulfate transporter family protein n=1 Tax=Prosthecobacter sp. SYSU 5D2 TaxID=3134134 RepID=UPI0031FEE726